MYAAVVAVDEGRAGAEEARLAQDGVAYLRARQVDGILLACTELPLMNQPLRTLASRVASSRPTPHRCAAAQIRAVEVRVEAYQMTTKPLHGSILATAQWSDVPFGVVAPVPHRRTQGCWYRGRVPQGPCSSYISSHLSDRLSGHGPRTPVTYSLVRCVPPGTATHGYTERAVQNTGMWRETVKL